MVDDALKAKPHTVDGKQVDPKRATPKEVYFGCMVLTNITKILVCVCVCVCLRPLAL